MKPIPVDFNQLKIENHLGKHVSIMKTYKIFLLFFPKQYSLKTLYIIFALHSVLEAT